MKQKLIIGGVIFIVLVGVWLMFSPSRKIEVTPLIVVVGKEQSVTLTATLITKDWFGNYYPTSGTLSPNFGNFVGVIPDQARTTGATPNATFTVTGVHMGKGKIIMNGSSNGGSHDIVEITTIVTRGT